MNFTCPPRPRSALGLALKLPVHVNKALRVAPGLSVGLATVLRGCLEKVGQPMSAPNDLKLGYPQMQQSQAHPVMLPGFAFGALGMPACPTECPAHWVASTDGGIHARLSSAGVRRSCGSRPEAPVSLGSHPLTLLRSEIFGLLPRSTILSLQLVDLILLSSQRLCRRYTIFMIE